MQKVLSFDFLELQNSFGYWVKDNEMIEFQVFILF